MRKTAAVMGGRPEVSERADRRWSGLPWWGSAVVGSVLILVIALPQFLRPAGPPPTNYAWHVAPDGEVTGGLIIDQVQFLQLTDAFSGDGPTELVVSPFSSRALGPWLAAALPVDAGTGLLIVNLASLVLGTFALAALAHDLTRRRDAVMWSVAVWSLAFPAFWYTGKPLIDAAVVGLVPLVLLASHRRRVVLGAVALAVAIWTKEAAVVLVLPLVASELMDRSLGRRRLWRSAAWIVVAVAAFATTGFLAGASNVTFAPWIPPSFDTVRQTMVNNLSGRGIVQYVLTAAPAVLALLWWLPRSRRDEHPDLEDPVVPYLIGIVVVLLLGAWSLWSALLDGRSVWMSLPFAAVLIGLWVAVTPLGQRAAEFRRTLRRLALPAARAGGGVDRGWRGAQLGVGGGTVRTSRVRTSLRGGATRGDEAGSGASERHGLGRSARSRDAIPGALQQF